MNNFIIWSSIKTRFLYVQNVIKVNDIVIWYNKTESMVK